MLVAVEHHVEDIGHRDHDDVAIDDIGDLVRHEIGTADDEDVKIHNHLAGRNVVELRHYQRDDVRSATVATHREGEADAAAAKGATDNGAHEGVKSHFTVNQEKLADIETLLPDNEKQRRHDDTVDGVGSELGAQHLEADGQQDAVDDEVQHTDRQRYVGCNVEHRRNTAYAAANNLGGQHEGRPREGVDGYAECDDHIGKYQLGFFLEDMHS